VVGTCKHLDIDPFAYLRDVLPAPCALGDSPHEEALGYWLSVSRVCRAAHRPRPMDPARLAATGRLASVPGVGVSRRA
jgi:hypothetical protein